MQYLPKLFVDEMIKYWTFEHVKVVSQLSNILKLNKDIDDIESMLISKGERKNIINYVEYSKICHVIRSFSDLNQTFGKKDITFPLSSSSREIEWRKDNLNGLDQFLDQIDTSMY